MNKARSLLFDAPFSFNGVRWNRWSAADLRRNIHIVVRIARTVVYPEFRGLGLGQLLIKHAVDFARKRWQVAGYLPLFLEISADMLKYVPFAERAGMTFVGETEGNLHRVAKDMNYLIARFGTHRTGQTAFERTSGICDQQASRKDRVLALVARQRLTETDVIDKLRNLSRGRVLKNFALFYGIVALPKPHYMKGLTRVAAEFIRARVSSLKIVNGRQRPSLVLAPIRTSIRVRKVAISYNTHVRRTQSTNAVQQAFGLSPDDIRTDVVKGLDVEFLPGRITLIVGPSGSGKTTIINSLISHSEPPSSNIMGTISVPPDARIGRFQPPRSRKPLIELVSSRGIAEGLFLLNIAGLSEAFLYLKRFPELSAGQQYRAMLALLLHSKKNVWIGDEFCANLDVVTANVVAHNVQAIARQSGATVVLAAPHYSNFLFSLRPDLVIQLTSACEHRVVDGATFCKEARQSSTTAGSPMLMRVRTREFHAVRRCLVTSLLRRGFRNYSPGIMLLECNSVTTPVRILGVTHTRCSQLDDGDARGAGLRDVAALRRSLRRVYPTLTSETPFTSIRIEPLTGVRTS